MAIEKSLYTMPTELETGADIELEIEGDESDAPLVVVMDDGSVEVSFEEETDPLADLPFDANLAEHLDATTLMNLSSDVIAWFESDLLSRREWEDALVQGMDSLGMKYEMRTEPWENACGVYSTVLSEAAIRFQAEAMSETFPAAGPVRTLILGKETKEKVEAAARVKADMNYELTERMVEYRGEHERMLYSLGLAGSAFKKLYDDPTLGRATSVYLSAEDVVVPYGATHIDTAERVTHVLRKTKTEMKALQAAGFYVDEDLGEPTPYHSRIEEKKAESGGYTMIDDDRYTLLEMCTRLHIAGVDAEDDEVGSPYIITIDKSSGVVLGIRRNWDEGDELKIPRQHYVHYIYIPGFGFYGLGLIHIIGGYAKAGTSLIRQLVDAGTLSNLPGGLKTRGMRIKGDDTPIEPGEFRDVDVTSGTIKDNIMTLPYKEPSQVLMMLLERITEEGRRLGAISDMKISDMSAQAPVGTTLAILERTLKPMAAVQARVHFAMRTEFKILKRLIAASRPEAYDYEPEYGSPGARRSDYEMVDVIPVSDPNSSTMAQRVVQYQAVVQLAQMAPQIYNLPVLHRQMIEVLGVKNADKLIPLAEDAAPTDPISENMGVLVGKPLKAFIYQDHQAHIAAHMSFMQDPMIAQTIGQNPMAQQIMAALQAHIAEHTGFLYRQQIEERLGAPLPPPGQQLPEEIEVQLSRLVADAGKQLTQIHQQQAAQQQAQQQAQDPVLQLEREKVANQKAEIDRKAQKDRVDAAVEAEKLALAEKELHLDAVTEAAKLAEGKQEAEVNTLLSLLKTMLTGKKPKE